MLMKNKLAFASFLSHEILSVSSLALVLIQVAFMPTFEPIKSPQKILQGLDWQVISC
jgi:hypothetical protein